TFVSWGDEEINSSFCMGTPLACRKAARIHPAFPASSLTPDGGRSTRNVPASDRASPLPETPDSADGLLQSWAISRALAQNQARPDLPQSVSVSTNQYRQRLLGASLTAGLIRPRGSSRHAGKGG